MQRSSWFRLRSSTGPNVLTSPIVLPPPFCLSRQRGASRVEGWALPDANGRCARQQLRGALEQVERLGVAALAAEKARPRPERLGERHERRAALGRVGRSEQGQGLARRGGRVARPAELERLLRLLGPEVGEILRLRLRPEQALGSGQVRARFLGTTGRVERPGTGKMGAGEMKAVVACAEQCDRAAEVVEREGRLLFERSQAAERAVEANPGQRIARFLDPFAQLREHRLGALELAEVAEREAQVSGEAKLVDGAVLEVASTHLLQAVREEPRRLARLADRRVGASERQVDIGALER